MIKKRILHILSFAAAVLTPLVCHGQDNSQQTSNPGEAPKPTKYISIEDQKEKLVLFQGFTLSFDLVGPVMSFTTDYGTLEGALRLNLKNTYFPIVEMGFGNCKKTDENTHVSFKVKAPYARIGADVNLLKDKFQDNRLYVGARYGLSKFKYDVESPLVTDPIWGGTEAFAANDIDCTSHWAELVFGVQVKVWRNLHMGWSVRYKAEISSTKSDYSKPTCIPGYGYTTNSTCWGGTYNLIFDLNWGKKHNKKKGVKVTVRDIKQDADIEDTDAETDEKADEEEGANATTKDAKAQKDDSSKQKNEEETEGTKEPNDGNNAQLTNI